MKICDVGHLVDFDQHMQQFNPFSIKIRKYGMSCALRSIKQIIHH